VSFLFEHAEGLRITHWTELGIEIALVFMYLLLDFGIRYGAQLRPICTAAALTDIGLATRAERLAYRTRRGNRIAVFEGKLIAQLYRVST